MKMRLKPVLNTNYPSINLDCDMIPIANGIYKIIID